MHVDQALTDSAIDLLERRFPHDGGIAADLARACRSMVIGAAVAAR